MEPGDGGILLGPVSYLDCIVFCLFLTPQLLWEVGLIETVHCVLRALPFLLLQLPIGFIHDRYFTPSEKQPLFIKRSSPFEDFVIRCVRYAFGNFPAKIGRVFFSKQVAGPFLEFRLYRHGYLKCPIHWKEYHDRSFKGIWITKDPKKKPDLVVYYAHGGGFSMGSTYFYLEFLLTWLSILIKSGYQNPAIFALEYTLVPDAAYPKQLEEATKAYEHVLEIAQDPSIVCVSGDSAGATLILCLLLHLGEMNPGYRHHLPRPALAVLISPWVTLISTRHKNMANDYIDVKQLHHYATQFAGDRMAETDPLVSPGCCNDIAWWKRSCPSKGIFITYGDAEVFAPEIEGLIKLLQEADVLIDSKAEPGGIHAWPVASLFLSSSLNDRLDGLRTITKEIRQRVP
ncbi:Alpha/Beta hydrolase protein [Podospora fimiseda]|uniref:Alpha/Beta hydrolase protein n=1 Tax=Podospora fimiseda TaxID=252190 RepID=A0AAN7BXQ7_9PEZI|nr:Alpha/Beta hydrolase protein [Podospora fimiseda]